MCFKDDELQKERQAFAKSEVDRIIAETPRQISIEMYVRSVAFAAFAAGWNGKARDMEAAEEVE